MTRFDPSLFLRRLVVQKSRSFVYDEAFSLGVNAICGENSSGKSSVMDLLFHCLGGDLSELPPEARSCDTVYGEFQINGEVVAFARDIDVEGQPPIRVFDGQLNDGLENLGGWLQFGVRSSKNRRSFSQEVFRRLGYPEVRDEASSLITMHQLLRLIYSDQTTSVERIFRDDPFERGTKRQAIADLLLGADDLRILDQQEKARRLEGALNELDGQLRALFRILRTTDTEFSPDALHNEISEIDAELEGLRSRLEEISSRAEQFSDDSDRKGVSQEVAQVEEDLAALRDRIRGLESERDDLAVDVDDSRAFISAIESRMEALNESTATLDWLGGIEFRYCPACLTPLEDVDEQTCRVCRSALEQDRASARQTRLYNELAFQLKESEQLLQRKLARLQELLSRIDRDSIRLGDLSMRYQTLVETSVNPREAEVRLLSVRLGYLQRAREDTMERLETAQVVDRKLREKARVEAELALMNAEIEKLQYGREERHKRLAAAISERTVSILHQDLGTEERFRSASVFEYDFSRNLMLVDGERSHSASSRTILKNSFLLALFSLSLEDPEIRWPRFLLMDNIEDKGMNPERSQNFQRAILEVSAASDVEHQIIFTTSMPWDYVVETSMVGRLYGPNSKTLAID